MRPVRLTLQAFGPYPAREVIDFRDAVQAGLFGIYGQTGSGKSTIFSAMTFALFGKPARDDQEAASVRSDHADRALQTEVELVFDIGPRRFVVLRRPEQMRPKQRGDGETRSAHEAFLFDATGMALDDISDAGRGKILAEKKVGLVDAAIRDMLGYGSEQFRQIVLLPQGRFETFLSAKTNERLSILRDLFDVSVYRSLAAKLKEDAQAAERLVSQERDLCARRLAAEGFESTDALAAGIAEAEGRLTELAAAEDGARKTSALAQAALQQADRIEAQFKAAEQARGALAELQRGKAEIDALADQVAKAARAGMLGDAENSVSAARQEVGEAEGKLHHAGEISTSATALAGVAVKALDTENDRAAEIDGLRKQVEDLARYRQTLENSAQVSTAVQTAQDAEATADGKLKAATAGFEALQAQYRTQSEALKAARTTEAARSQLATDLTRVQARRAAAETFETAELGVAGALRDVEAKTSERDAAAETAERAATTLEAVEQDLAHVQALHLASKLSSGAPCPVCGATEHPAPATGAAEHAGRDLAFREAKAAWQKADAAARAAELDVTAARSVHEERAKSLASLERPAEAAAELRKQQADVQAQLDALGARIDVPAAEAQIEHVLAQIADHERTRDGLGKDLAQLQAQAVAVQARQDEMLSGIPEEFRAHAALEAASEGAAQALAARQAAKLTAETEAKEARETALKAAKDLEAAEAALATCKARLAKATDHFQSRLAQSGLDAAAYQALRPAIATIEEDRRKIENFRSDLRAAESAAQIATEAVADQTRPDLSALQAAWTEAETQLSHATDARAGAGHRRDHLVRLRSDLAETLRKLDNAEAASGPLRGLAGLVNGTNPQKLDLETFAIGAMFDQVLEAANLRLGPMTTNRYQLERDMDGSGVGRRGLGIQVFDIYTGKARPTTTLSGGETFIAALALALGLADIVEAASGKVRLDTIFIDEGFGSLDTENGAGTLDQVLQVLSGLVSQNRAVGLISHVPLVQEAIPNGFYVRKGLSGSHVEARDLV